MGFIMKSVTGPTVTAGSFNLYFGEFEEIEEALISYDQSNNTDGSGQIDISYNYITEYGSKNYVTLYAKYIHDNTVRVAATTAILAGKKFVILARGH